MRRISSRSIRRLGIGFLIAGLFVVADGAKAAHLITNGDFSTGDFTGFSIVNFGTNGGTGDGGTSEGLPAVRMFDVTGSGVQNAVKLNVGITSGQPGFVIGGVSISQIFATAGGPIDFSAAIAVDFDGYLNNIPGTFVAYIDGNQIAYKTFPTIYTGETYRGTLAGLTTLSAGAHSLKIDIYRDYYQPVGLHQYITNIDIIGAPVPEPSTAILFAAGIAGIWLIVRRREDASQETPSK